MADDISKQALTADALEPRRIGIFLAVGGVLGLMLAGTLALWMHYGTAVFFETIRAGFVACFG